MKGTRTARRLPSLVLTLALCSARVAAAQEEGAPRPPPAAEPSAADQAAGSTDALVQESYDAAFDALAHGDRRKAVELLKALLSAAPEHPLAPRAKELLAAITESTPAALPALPAERPEPAPQPAPARARTTSNARAETVFFQTLHGMALGVEVCAIASCTQTQPWVASLMLGAGAGFGLSFGLSNGGVTPGLARALTDGTLWGAANGFGLMVATGALEHSGNHAATVGAFLALGQLTGVSLAAGLAIAWQPTTGQVSLTASGGIWSLVIGGELLGMAQSSQSAQTVAAILMTLSNAGVAGGGLLARAVPMPASRVLLLDAGGLLGTLTGLGIAGIAQGRSLAPTPTLGACLVGTLGGLALAYYVTDDWADRDDTGPTASFGLVPAPGGGMASLHGRF